MPGASISAAVSTVDQHPNEKRVMSSWLPNPQTFFSNRLAKSTFFSNPHASGSLPQPQIRGSGFMMVCRACCTTSLSNKRRLANTVQRYVVVGQFQENLPSLRPNFNQQASCRPALPQHVKKPVLQWNPGKWKYGPKPAEPPMFNFEPHPHGSIRLGAQHPAPKKPAPGTKRRHAQACRLVPRPAVTCGPGKLAAQVGHTDGIIGIITNWRS